MLFVPGRVVAHLALEHHVTGSFGLFLTQLLGRLLLGRGHGRGRALGQVVVVDGWQTGWTW